MSTDDTPILISKENLKSVNPKKKSVFAKLNILLREIVAISFWIYLLTKVFLFDIDTFLVSHLFPGFQEIVQYKFLILIGIISIFWIITKSNNLLTWFFYICFYPFVVVFWKIPKTIYKIGSWNFGIAVLNSFLSFFRSLKYSFFSFTLFLISTVLILSFNSKTILVIASFLLFVVLIATYINRFILVFKPSFIYRLHSKIVSFMLDITKQTWTADKGLKELTTAQMTSSQLQTWSHHLQTAVIANKSCYFFSSKLRAYQKSRINVIFNVFSVLLLFVFTVFCFSLLNFSLYKIQPQAYQFVSIKPDFFSFFYYSFNAIHFNSIPEVTTINNLSRSLFLFEQFFALILIGIFFTLFLSIKNEKESADIDEVVNKIKVQGDIMGEYISTEYKMSVDDAIVEVQKLKGALIKVIFYLTKNIT